VSPQRARGRPVAGGAASVTAGGAATLWPAVGPGARLPSSRQGARQLVDVAVATVIRLLPKKATRIVLHSPHDVEDGLIAVADECAARGWVPTFLVEDPRRGPLLRSLTAGRVDILPRRSVRGVLAFLTARYVLKTDRLYGDRRPPAAQVVVTLWHGEPPSKLAGRFRGRGGVLSTFAPVCSTVGRAYRAAEFGMHPLQVPIVGAPRNDRMLRADREAVRTRLLGAEADRPTLLWMPSFRRPAPGRRADDAGEGPYPERDLRRLDAWLHEHGARVVVKVHPSDRSTFAGEFRALSVLQPGDLERQGLTLYPALSAFDGLITDMSSIWLDYLLLDKPLIFAFPDVADYRSDRGLNLEPYEAWVPGPFATTIDEFLAAVQDVVEGRDPAAEERRRARVRFHQYRDDATTARLLDGIGITRR
jgi:CDP-glycerol glycerophosphotransferase